MKALKTYVTGTGPKLLQTKLPEYASVSKVDELAEQSAEALYGFLFRSVTKDTFDRLRRLIEERCDPLPPTA